MPPRPNNQQVRHRIKIMETNVKERCMNSEAKWSGEQGILHQRNVNTVLTILEELDSYLFDRMDSSSNSLDSLFSRLFSASNNPQDLNTEDTLVHTLCEWAVTSMRYIIVIFACS